MIPNTPLAGSAVPAPLVSWSQYKRLTGDTTTAERDVEEAIADAVQDLSQYCGRTFEYGQYTENQYLYAQGMVYPSANPLDPSKPIADSGGNLLFDPTDPVQATVSIIQGDGIWIGYFLPLPFIWTGVFNAQTVVTYWGGYFPYQYDDTAQGAIPITTETLPRSAAMMIAKYAYYSTHPVAVVGVPAGVKSVSVGGVSMSGDLSAFSMDDPGLKSAVRRWRNPMAHPWDA